MKHQKGSAIFYILIAIVLFAALSYAFSSTMSSSSSNLTKEEARVYAQDVLNYANKLSRAVNRVLQKGNCSENDVSFYLSTNALLSAYQHTPEVDDTCKVFHETGGAITWLVAPEGVNDGSDWIFSGNNRVRDFGSYIDGTGNELVAFLPYIDENVCKEINVLLGVINDSDDIPEDADDISTIVFTSEYSSSISKAIYKGSDGGLLRNQPTACFKADTIDGSPASGDVYFFYHVLITR